MAAIDYGTLILKNGEPIFEVNEHGYRNLFPTIQIGSYNVHIYKSCLKIWEGDPEEDGWEGKSVTELCVYDRFAIYADTPLGRVRARRTNRKRYERALTTLYYAGDKYEFFSGYGVDPDHRFCMQKKIWREYGFSPKEIRIAKRFLFGREGERR